MPMPHTKFFLSYAEMIASEDIIMFHVALPSFYKKKKKTRKKMGNKSIVLKIGQLA